MGESPAQNGLPKGAAGRFLSGRPSIAAPSLAPKNSFPEPTQPDRPAEPDWQKDSSFFFSEIDVLSRRPVSIRGALRGRHER